MWLRPQQSILWLACQAFDDDDGIDSHMVSEETPVDLPLSQQSSDG